MKVDQLPKPGASLEAGKFCGITTTPDGTHHAVVLLPDKPDKRLDWQAAMDWAASVKGTLPSRPVAAMLFANAKPEFEEAWHWTCETASWDGSFAWLQYFSYGIQGSIHKSYEGRARAVRLIQLSA
jgi:hypothetical protein